MVAVVVVVVSVILVVLVVFICKSSYLSSIEVGSRRSRSGDNSSSCCIDSIYSCSSGSYSD